MEEKEVKKNRILVIEDENDVRAVYVEILTRAGYKVDEAADGITGMQKIKEGNWDLLFLDILLPGLDGLTMLKEIKEKPALKKGPIIALTNLSSVNVMHIAYEEGIDDYLVKSDITPDKIIDEIEKVFGKEEKKS